MNQSIEKLLASLSREQAEEFLKQVRQRASGSKAPNAMKVRIRITEGTSLHPSKQPKTPPRPEDEPTVRALARLTPALREAFIKADSKVLSWLRSSQENRTHFLLDPVSALTQAVPGFDKRLIEEIKNLRAASARTPPDIPGLQLDTLELEVASGEEGEKR